MDYTAFSSQLVRPKHNSPGGPHQSTTLYSLVAQDRHTHGSKTPTNFESFIISAGVWCEAGDSSTAVPQMLHFG